MSNLRAIICYRRTSSNPVGRIGDFVATKTSGGELIYKGRVYGEDDMAQFNIDAKKVSGNKSYFQPPYVKFILVEDEKPAAAPPKTEAKAPAKKVAAAAPAKKKTSEKKK